jgi:3-methyladenine DNA glycosylase AlkC
MHHISSTLNKYLPHKYIDSIVILKNTFMDMPLQYALENMIFQDYVEIFGLDYFEISMDALACFTVNSSSEFAIRKFILKYPHETMKQMYLWSKNSNEHLRRLSSEGCRPRLPWAISLPLFKNNPEEVLAILELLKDDTSKYVQKSVANNLNDISKDNPDIIRLITKQWIGKNKIRDWILKHGCRTLLKNSDKVTLGYFGFQENKELMLENFNFTKIVTPTKDLKFDFILNSKKRLGKVRIEFVIDFLRQKNKYNSKIFKILESDINETSKQVSKTYSFKAISTRKYYKGLHKIRIIINGVSLKEETFTLN